MTEQTQSRRVSIRDTFIYKHGFSIILGLLAILSILVTTSVVITQKTNATTDMRKGALQQHIEQSSITDDNLDIRLNELTRRIEKLERGK